MSKVSIRPANVADGGALLRMIEEFAAFDGRSARVEATVDGLRALLGSQAAPMSFIVAETADDVLGFASFYRTYSTSSLRAADKTKRDR